MVKTVFVALHYQNENCHPDGRIRVGIAADAPWREERMNNARRLMRGLREKGVEVVHVRLAVDPGYREVTANTDLIRGWIEAGAWKEGTWGVEFLNGLGPEGDELVVTHTRNSAFHGSTLDDALRGLGAERLIFAGVSTAYAVEGSVRHATDIGYECAVVADACATATNEQHEAALRAMTPLARIMTVDEAIAE